MLDQTLAALSGGNPILFATLAVGVAFSTAPLLGYATGAITGALGIAGAREGEMWAASATGCASGPRIPHCFALMVLSSALATAPKQVRHRGIGGVLLRAAGSAVSLVIPAAPASGIAAEGRHRAAVGETR